MASGTTSSARPGVTPGPYFKVTIFFRKRADLTDDYFHTYWRKNHCDLALDSKVFMGKVRRYSQVLQAHSVHDDDSRSSRADTLS